MTHRSWHLHLLSQKDISQLFEFKHLHRVEHKEETYLIFAWHKCSKSTKSSLGFLSVFPVVTSKISDRNPALSSCDLSMRARKNFPVFLEQKYIPKQLAWRRVHLDLWRQLQSNTHTTHNWKLVFVPEVKTGTGSLSVTSGWRCRCLFPRQLWRHCLSLWCVWNCTCVLGAWFSTMRSFPRLREEDWIWKGSIYLWFLQTSSYKQVGLNSCLLLLKADKIRIQRVWWLIHRGLVDLQNTSIFPEMSMMLILWWQEMRSVWLWCQFVQPGGEGSFFQGCIF